MAFSAADSGRKLRVLIAEDDEEFRHLLTEGFAAEGYEVTACRHGLEFVGQLERMSSQALGKEFDLIVSDVRMPGVTGISVLEGLQEREDVPPVILITAFGDASIHQQATRCGAAAILDKPFELAELLSKAREAIAGRSAG